MGIGDIWSLLVWQWPLCRISVKDMSGWTHDCTKYSSCYWISIWPVSMEITSSIYIFLEQGQAVDEMDALPKWGRGWGGLMKVPLLEAPCLVKHQGLGGTSSHKEWQIEDFSLAGERHVVISHRRSQRKCFPSFHHCEALERSSCAIYKPIYTVSPYYLSVWRV